MPVGEQTFEYSLGKQFFANMESADIHDADLHVTLTVSHKQDIYHLQFDIEGTITLICDRCLDDLIYPLTENSESSLATVASREPKHASRPSMSCGTSHVYCQALPSQ